MPEATPAYRCELNPHNWMSKTCHPKGHCGDHPPHTPQWFCNYCGDFGSLAELSSRACAYEYPPCGDCGLTPICSINCSGISKVLESESIYIAKVGGAMDKPS